MSPFARRTAAIAHKEVLHIIRDARAVYLALGLPLVMLVLFGYGLSTDIDHIPMAVVDDDHTHSSRAMVEALVAGGQFTRERELQSAKEAEPLLRRGDVKVVLVLPRNYERDLLRGDRPGAQLLVDGSDGSTATIAIGDAAGIVQSMPAATTKATQASLSEAPKVRVRFNPAMRSTYNMVSGVIVLILSMVASVLTAVTVAREWERGSMEQLFATPVTRAEIIVGKLLPYAGLGLVQTLLVVTLGSFMFDMPIRGSLATLFASSVMFLLAILAFGLIASVAAKNQLVAVQFSLFGTFMPVSMLSGFLFPVDNMPPWLRALSMIVPGRYYLVALRGTLLKGNSIDVLAPQVLALAVFAVLALVLAVSRFKRRLS